MLFLTAASIGVCAGMMRSAFSVAFIAFLIVATFALATLTSPGPASYLNLLIAILGYNAGLINFLAGLLLIRRLRAA
ncbi:hypothetical protein ABK249_03985 [Neorhizobium sp. Rsf11]|uniref:Integral membrane protein n=2 Tax=Neorhizobium TaxID=1525371 RepID=A0ABV0LWV9_9HYPH|nr:hypothetical protein [Neorhizobium petrolearium]MCC2613339.1 hypothetical protein [Neorhizobium petrolearium]WGI68422.1 hypothetical protein QEO92_26300 [Neorhizobium petrolearium]